MVMRRGADGILRSVSKRRLVGRVKSREYRARKRAERGEPSVEKARRAQAAVDLAHIADARKGRAAKSLKALEAAAAKGELPLAYFLRVMRDKELPDVRRDWAAGQAAPYLHPRLASTELSSDPDRPLALEPEQQLGLVRQIAFALALGARLQREATPHRAERVISEAKK